MNGALNAVLAIVGAIITLAIIATLVSRNSATPDVLKASGDLLSGVIKAAVTPVSTAATNGNPLLSTFASPAGAIARTPAFFFGD